MAKATLYLIRHGEKPPAGDDLSAQGVDRAQALRQVFDSSSQYDIGYIIAEHPKKDGSRRRPLDTVTPLSQDLGLEVNTRVDRDDAAGVADAVQAYTGSGNILVCWEHGQLQDIMQGLGVNDPPAYPGDRFDLIYTLLPPYTAIASITSENTPADQGLPSVQADL